MVGYLFLTPFFVELSWKCWLLVGFLDDPNEVTSPRLIWINQPQKWYVANRLCPNWGIAKNLLVHGLCSVRKIECWNAGLLFRCELFILLFFSSCCLVLASHDCAITIIFGRFGEFKGSTSVPSKLWSFDQSSNIREHFVIFDCYRSLVRLHGDPARPSGQQASDQQYWNLWWRLGIPHDLRNLRDTHFNNHSNNQCILQLLTLFGGFLGRSLPGQLCGMEQTLWREVWMVWTVCLRCLVSFNPKTNCAVGWLLTLTCLRDYI